MLRKAISYTMTLVVVIMVLVMTAAAVITLQSGGFQSFDQTWNAWFGEGRAGTIKEQCEIKAGDWCEENSPPPEWPEAVYYNDETCASWNESDVGPLWPDNYPSCSDLTD